MNYQPRILSHRRQLVLRYVKPKIDVYGNEESVIDQQLHGESVSASSSLPLSVLLPHLVLVDSVLSACVCLELAHDVSFVNIPRSVKHAFKQEKHKD